MNINWITAEDIDAWAKKKPRRAQEILPELVAKLIRASSDKIDSLNVPNIQSSGYDGTLVASEQTNYFPKGKSVWELGTDEDALSKFKPDIDKRSTDPLLVDITKAEFIFVTIKIWKHKNFSIERTINEARQKYYWKNIHILDAHELSRWLDDCPSVAIWLSKAIGSHIRGVISAEHYWDDLSDTTNPKLTPDCLIIDREPQIETLSKWLYSPTEYLIVKAESSLEAVLFTVATVLKMEEKQKETLLSRIIIIEDREVWQEVLDSANKSSILIPMFPSADIKCSRDMCVLFPVSKFDTIGKLDERDYSIDLQKYKPPQFDELLKLLGYNSSDCANIVFNTKRSFLPLYRKITTNPTRKEPRWVTRENIRDLLPAMFAGGWNDSCSGDRRVIEILSGRGFDEYTSALREWLVIEDAPVLMVSHNYYTVSVHDIWNYLFSRIVSRDLENIEKCLSDVFSQVDPTFELPEEQWPFANVYGKKHEHSQNLIHGLIITLIMLSEHDGRDKYFHIPSTKRWVDSVVEQLLEPISTWQHWNTIAPTLPLLAEASPIAVVERLEKAVNNDDADFWRSFNPSKDVLLGRNYYTHILWTLEKMVWNNETAVLAIKLLAQIGEKEIEYKMENTPHNSLYEIFCLWRPQNCLNVDERMNLLEVIVSSYPTVGWKLLIRLLPTWRNSICTNISRPRWREFSDRYSDGIPHSEYRSCVEQVIDMCLQHVGTDKLPVERYNC